MSFCPALDISIAQVSLLWKEFVTKFSTFIVFHDSNPSGPLINRRKYFQIRFDFAEIFDHKVVSAVCCTLQRQKSLPVNQNFILQILSFVIDVFTPKRISLDCPFKGNQRQVKISILSLRCAVSVCLRGMLHTAEIVSAVCCRPRRSSPWWDAHRGDMFEI